LALPMTRRAECMFFGMSPLLEAPRAPEIYRARFCVNSKDLNDSNGFFPWYCHHSKISDLMSPMSSTDLPYFVLRQPSFPPTSVAYSAPSEASPWTPSLTLRPSGVLPWSSSRKKWTLGSLPGSNSYHRRHNRSTAGPPRPIPRPRTRSRITPSLTQHRRQHALRPLRPL